MKDSKSSLILLKEQELMKEKNENNDIKSLSGENKEIMNAINVPNEPLRNINIIDNTNEVLKNVYINNWLICCIWCTSKKKNVNKILFEEGSRILTERLDILNMFNKLFTVELIQKQLGIEPSGMGMSDMSNNS